MSPVIDWLIDPVFVVTAVALFRSLDSMAPLPVTLPVSLKTPQGVPLPSLVPLETILKVAPSLMSKEPPIWVQ